MPDVFYNDIYTYAMEMKPRVIVIYGGRDSGKSYFAGGQYIPMAMIEEPGLRVAVIRDTYASCKDSVYAEINDGIEALESVELFTSTKQPLEINCINKSKAIFRGMDDPTKIKSLKGISCIWFEEAENMTERQFWDLMILLRGDGYQRMLMTFNPTDEDHFANAMFTDIVPDRVLERFDDGEKKVWTKVIREEVQGETVEFEALVICSTYEDNHFISPIRKAVIEGLASVDPYLYEVYRKGRYGRRGGRILTNYEEADFTEKGWLFENFDNRGYGQDWGYNHASCTLWVAEKDDCLFVFDEIYEYEKDTDEYEEIMRKKGVSKHITILSESAEPDRVKTIRKKGYKITEVKKYNGSVKAQIDKLKRYKKIYINSTCKNTLKEVKAYTWKMNKQGKYTDEPVTVFDDAMAALRYSTDLFDKQSWGISGVFK